MIISEVCYDDLTDRLDSEFYRPQYLIIDKKLSNITSNKLGDLLEKIVRDPMGYGFNYVKKGIPYYRVDDLQNPYLNVHKAVFISLAIHKKLSKTILYHGDILMAVRGSTIGRLGLYYGKDEEGNISPNVIILRPEKKEMSAYIAVYLLSPIGKQQIDRIQAGTGQPTITVPYIKDIKIPIPSLQFQQEIQKLVQEIYVKRDKVTETYNKAEKLLEETLNIEELGLSSEKFFSINYEDLAFNQRLDADYYLPKFTAIYEVLNDVKFEKKRLKDLCEEAVRPINPHKYPDKKFTYIEIGDIDTLTGGIGKKEITGYEAPPNAARLLKAGDLVVSTVRPTRGAITIIPPELGDAVGTSAFHILKAPSPLREFLFIYLRSVIGINQLGRHVVGAMYPTLEKKYIDNIIVPSIPLSVQNEISQYVKQSFLLQKETQDILNTAINKVEKFINIT